MFNSNVAPRRRIKTTAEWLCEWCDRKVKRYHNNCPACGAPRPE